MADYDPFAPDYDAWGEHVLPDVEWYVGLARAAEEPIVELAVGTGRVATEIARATGKRVIGIDASPAMLAVARERAAGLGVELREGDMRELSLDDPVDLVICPGRSLMHLPNWAGRRRVFERVAATLQPGGRFAWNVFAFDPALSLRLDGTRAEHPDGRWEELHYDFAHGRLDLTRGRDDETHGTISLWWIAQSEWDGLLEVAGLELESLHGGFAGEPFTEESRELVYVARRP
jgi:SAM-dependent methyltransferase